MTLVHGTDRLESARLALRRVVPEDLPFFTRLDALPDVAQSREVNGTSVEGESDYGDQHALVKRLTQLTRSERRRFRLIRLD
jgi:hypothetical protein